MSNNDAKNFELDHEVLEILRNFQQINEGIRFEQSNKLRTKSIHGNVYASAVLKTAFPKEFCISDLKKFISTLDLFDKPVLDFEQADDYLVVREKDGKTKTKYHYADPKVVTYPEKSPSLKNEDVYVELSKEQFSTLTKATGILEASYIYVAGKKMDKIYIMAGDLENPETDEYMIETKEDAPADFRFAINVEALNFMKDGYYIAIDKRGLAKFSGESKPVEYAVALTRHLCHWDEGDEE